MTPKLLRYMAAASSVDVVNNPVDRAMDLIIGAFFFAMKSCEFAWSSRPGKTKRITLGGTKFFDAQMNEIHHDDPNLPQMPCTYGFCL